MRWQSQEGIPTEAEHRVNMEKKSCGALARRGEGGLAKNVEVQVT